MAPLNSGYEYRSTTRPEDVGTSVVEYLAAHFPHSDGEEWRRRIEAGLVRIDGAQTEPSRTLAQSETVVWLRPPWEEPDAPCGFALLYRDAHLLAVAKPRGLPVLPGAGYLERTLFSLVRKYDRNANPLHRLGRGTSGLVLFSRSREAARRLSDVWCRREVTKVYRALVTGLPAEDHFVIEAPVGRIPHGRLGAVHAAAAGGKPARSEVFVLERRSGESLVEVRIITGRTHQVRIHLAAAGHPLVGDLFYAPGGLPSESVSALPGDTGFHLHAETLRFIHPCTGALTELNCPPPPILRLRNPEP
jgi:23S rRNA pseudouridine1911/1915/1917 synthase